MGPTLSAELAIGVRISCMRSLRFGTWCTKWCYFRGPTQWHEAIIKEHLVDWRSQQVMDKGKTSGIRAVFQPWTFRCTSSAGPGTILVGCPC